jgi:hypothetical protein
VYVLTFKFVSEVISLLEDEDADRTERGLSSDEAIKGRRRLVSMAWVSLATSLGITAGQIALILRIIAYCSNVYFGPYNSSGLSLITVLPLLFAKGQASSPYCGVMGVNSGESGLLSSSECI